MSVNGWPTSMRQPSAGAEIAIRSLSAFSARRRGVPFWPDREFRGQAAPCSVSRMVVRQEHPAALCTPDLPVPIWFSTGTVLIAAWLPALFAVASAARAQDIPAAWTERKRMWLLLRYTLGQIGRNDQPGEMEELHAAPSPCSI